jgi:hypothetical protein
MRRYQDDDVLFRSRPEDARVDSPMVALPSGRVVTSLPLADGIAPMLGSVFLRASLTRVDAIAALAMFGLELPDLETIREMDRAGLWIPPQTLVFDAIDQQRMRSLGYRREHDRRCWGELAERGVTAPDQLTKCVANFGKLHIAGAAPGNNRLAGWSRKQGGEFIQKGIADNHKGEAASLFDYGTLVVGVVPMEMAA